MSKMGLKVLQIGCDPKSDSTKLLLNGRNLRTILDMYDESSIENVVVRGNLGVLCAECGGPRPGTGCAGRGIIAAFEMLESEKVVERYAPDVIIYDVLGDVVCGGFAMPIRNGYAKDVFIVSSGEMMSLYAAHNISIAVNDMRDLGYAKLGGIIQNSKNIEREDRLVDDAAREIGVEVVYRVPRDRSVQTCEGLGLTVVEHLPDSEQARHYTRLAETIIERTVGIEGGMRFAR